MRRWVPLIGLILVFFLLGASERQVTIEVPEDGLVTGEDEVYIIQGSEVLLTQGETQIRTSWLRFEAKTNRASSVGGVQITQEDLSITAGEMEINLDTEEIELTHDVVMLQDRPQEGKESKRLRLTAQSLVLWSDTREMKASGSVYLQEGEREIWADHLHYIDATGELFLEGNVLFIEGDKRLEAAKTARFDVDSGSFTVQGPAKLQVKLEEKGGA